MRLSASPPLRLQLNTAFDRSKGEEVVELSPDPTKPMVALAFKLQPSRFGQLTYMRIYQVSAALGSEKDAARQQISMDAGQRRLEGQGHGRSPPTNFRH